MQQLRPRQVRVGRPVKHHGRVGPTILDSEVRTGYAGLRVLKDGPSLKFDTNPVLPGPLPSLNAPNAESQ
jgi:hypothetical protein